MGKIIRIPYKGGELLSPKMDLVFKAILTADGDLELLASLLSSILDMDIKPEDISVANTELTGTHKKDKRSSIDVRVKLADGKHINIEIQVDENKNFAARSIYYVSKLYAGQLGSSMDYSVICPTIAINILDYNCLPFEEYHNRYRLKNVRNNHELTDIFEVNLIELDKIPKVPGNMKELWMSFFAAETEEELEMLAKESPVIEKAVNKLVYFSADEQLRYDLDMREKWELDNATREAEYKRIEKRLEAKEKDVEAKEKELEEREKALEEREKELARKSSYFLHEETVEYKA